MSRSRLKKADSAGISKLLSWISANPLESAIHSRLMAKAQEFGYDPIDLIDSALGSVKLDKSGALMSQDITDILNQVYEDDPTPGRRYVIDPREAITRRGKEVAGSLKGNLGVAQSINTGRSRSLPDYAAIRMPYTEADKLKAIADAGHELRHSSDSLIRPDLKMLNPNPYTEGHHYGDIYETSELNREARNLPKDEKTAKEILKRSKKSMINSTPFMRLRSILSPLAAGAGLYSALQSKDTLAAGLEGAALLDPTGVADAAAEINRRLKMSPEEQENQQKEDMINILPEGLWQEQQMLNDLEKYNKKKKGK